MQTPAKTLTGTLTETPTHIYLVRHAQKRSDFGDPGLTAVGLQQAQVTATYFAKVGVDAVCSSPRLRARETATFIARETNNELEIDERLTERSNWGDLPGQTFPEFEKMWMRATNDRDWHPPVGDSSRHAGMRMTRAVFHMAHQQKRRVVLVTHAGAICDLVRNLFSPSTLDALVPNFSIETDACIHECSITELIVDRDARYIEIVWLAGMRHLPDELK